MLIKSNGATVMQQQNRGEPSGGSAFVGDHRQLAGPKLPTLGGRDFWNANRGVQQENGMAKNGNVLELKCARFRDLGVLVVDADLPRGTVLMIDEDRHVQIFPRGMTAEGLVQVRRQDEDLQAEIDAQNDGGPY